MGSGWLCFSKHKRNPIHLNIPQHLTCFEKTLSGQPLIELQSAFCATRYASESPSASTSGETSAETSREAICEVRDQQLQAGRQVGGELGRLVNKQTKRQVAWDDSGDKWSEQSITNRKGNKWKGNSREAGVGVPGTNQLVTGTTLSTNGEPQELTIILNPLAV